MSKKIEIFENTLLKLLVRRGTDIDRRQIVLSEGELGYVIDTKKLYVGDGQTKGGILVGGSKFLGAATDVTSFTSAVTGDMAFDSDDEVLYYLVGGSPSNISNWVPIGGVYSNGNGTINVSNTNKITVNKLSAGNFSSNALGNSLRLDSANKIALDSTIKISQVDLDPTSSFLSIPDKVSVGTQTFTLPTYAGGSNLFLTSTLDGTLDWQPAGDSTIYVAGTASQIPVGSIMPFISGASAPPGWLLCNGTAVPKASYNELWTVIGSTYGSTTTTFNLPDFVNKTIYGVSSNPGSATIFNVASGTNSTLKAAGAFYIIKAKPDTVVNSTITIKSPLTATLNNTPVTNTTVDALRGNLVIGIDNAILTRLTKAENNAAPVGSIMPFAMEDTPEGWLDCDGQVYNGTLYPVLCAKLGTLYNRGGEGTGQFRVPDLRGYFVRGAGTNWDNSKSGNFGKQQAGTIVPMGDPSKTAKMVVSLYNNVDDQTTTMRNVLGGEAPIIPNTATFNSNLTINSIVGSTDSVQADKMVMSTRPNNIPLNYCIKHD